MLVLVLLSAAALLGVGLVLRLQRPRPPAPLEKRVLARVLQRARSAGPPLFRDRK
jgi:hypothetical protein